MFFNFNAIYKNQIIRLRFLYFQVPRIKIDQVAPGVAPDQYGWWYDWCYTYGYECTGGTYQIDSGDCEESTVEFQAGDINNDYI